MVRPFVGLDQMVLPFTGEPPYWEDSFGTEIILDERMLHTMYHQTRDDPLEYRNELLYILQQHIIPMRNRWRDLEKSERNEAFALNSKYNNLEDGLYAKLLEEYTAFMVDLETRHPSLASWIKELDKRDITGGLMEVGDSKFISAQGKPSIVLGQHGSPPYYHAVVVKGLEAVRDHLVEKATLLESQNKALTRAFEENGLQIPHECTDVQRQIDAFKRSTSDELAQAEEAGQKRGEQKDTSPEARLMSFREEPTEPTFTAVYENRSKPFVLPPPPPKEIVRREMSWDGRMKLLKTICIDRCGKFFARPLTEENSPHYFDVVKDHRDLTTIRADMNNVDLEYDTKDFFHDIRLMLDNYTHVFGEGSKEQKLAERFEQVMLVCLKDYGKCGERAKKHFESAPRAQFIQPPEADETIPPSEAEDGNDNSIDEDAFETSYAQGIRNDYEDDYGEGRDDSYFGQNDDVLDYADENGPGPQTPGLLGPAQQPRGHSNPSPSVHGPAEQSEVVFDPLEAAWGKFDAAKGYDQDHGNALRAPGFGTTLARDYEDGPNSPAPGASGSAEARAGQSGDQNTHDLEHPAPRAPTNAQQNVTDLTSSPQRQTGHIGSAARKRTRESDEQDASSDDGAPLIKRLKMTAKSTSDEQPLSSKRWRSASYAASTSLGKRSRNDSDDDDEQEPQQPSKRKKASSLSVPEPVAPVAAAAGDGVHDNTSLSIEELFAPFQSPPRPAQDTPQPAAAAAQVGEHSLAPNQNLLGVIRNDELPPSPIPEPLSPVLAAAVEPSSVSPPPVSGRPEIPESVNGASDAEGHESMPGSNSPNAAADEPQPEPATEDLGHTNNGTTTVSKLQKLPKYKKKSGSKGRGRPNRRWVFGHRFGNEYGLYIMGCPTKGCEPADTMIFATHPLKHNGAANHLTEECGHVFADDDDMVRKTCTQVISDDKKAVSIEWARKWNSDLMKEYGNEDCEDDNTF